MRDESLLAQVTPAAPSRYGGSCHMHPSTTCAAATPPPPPHPHPHHARMLTCVYVVPLLFHCVAAQTLDLVAWLQPLFR